MPQDLFPRPRRTVGALGAEGVVDVNGGEYAGRQGYRVPLEAARVAGAVPFLVVAVGDVEGGAEIDDGRKELIGDYGVPPHDLPLVFIERAGLEEYPVGDAHLADVVEQGAPAHVDMLLLSHVHLAGYPERQVRNAAAVALGLPVPQVQGPGPALYRFVVGERQVHVGALQLIEERGVVYGYGGLSGQGLEEVHPVPVALLEAAAEDLEDPLYSPLGDERGGVIGDEPLFWQEA